MIHKLVQVYFRYRLPLTDSDKTEQIKKEKREKVYLTGKESAGKRGQ